MIKLIPMQQLLGVFSFLVFGGERHGSQVMVRAYCHEWYEQKWAESKDFARYDRASFEENVLGEIGIVHDGSRHVPPDVVCAVWNELQRMRLTNPDIFVNSISTGFYAPEVGWVRSSFEAIPLPIVRESSPEEFDSISFPEGVRALSLAARHRNYATS
jgi:hypothetical protein